MEKDTILNAVDSYIGGNPARFHMPGHKGRAIDARTEAIFGGILPYDVTELDETDNLLAAEGPYLGSFRRASKLYGTKSTTYSVGGATLAIQTAVRLAQSASEARGKPEFRLLCDRRAHKSAVNAFALCDITPDWFFPGTKCDGVADFSAYDAVFVTSPDYYGRMLDVASYAGACHRTGTKLIVDNSHGAHLAFYDGGRLHAYHQGADMAVDSLHKTLPAMTGAALLHLRDDFSREEISGAMSLFSTTSPSYAIGLSIDACLEHMARDGERLHSELLSMLGDTRERLLGLGFALSEFELSDPFRLCLLDKNSPELYDHLKARGVVCEFRDRSHVVLIPSVMNTRGDFDLLLDACADFEAEPADETRADFTIPECALTIRRAVFARREMISTGDAEDRISAEPVAPYPPGIPLVMPGEVFSRRLCGEVKAYGINEVCAVAK